MISSMLSPVARFYALIEQVLSPIVMMMAMAMNVALRCAAYLPQLASLCSTHQGRSSGDLVAN
jgi:hypothetical protein